MRKKRKGEALQITDNMVHGQTKTQQIDIGSKFETKKTRGAQFT